MTKDRIIEAIRKVLKVDPAINIRPQNTLEEISIDEIYTDLFLSELQAELSIPIKINWLSKKTTIERITKAITQ